MMVKKILLPCIALALALAMGAGLLGATPRRVSAADPVALTWFVRENGTEQQWQNQVIQQFEAAHPGIIISLMVVPFNDLVPRLNGLWLQGNPPDVWSPAQSSTGFKNDFAKGRLADLTPYIKGTDPLDLADFYPSTIAQYTVEDKTYGLPILSGGSYIFYNKDMFDAAGVAYPPTNWSDTSWTWAALVAKAKLLTKNYNDPDTSQYGYVNRLNPNDAYAWLWGQDLFPASAYQTGYSTEAYLDSAASLQAFQAQQGLFCSDFVSPTLDEMERLGGSAEGVFMNQRAAMVATGLWGLWMFKGNGFNWGFAALPKGAAGAKDVVFTDEWGMSSRTAHPQEAWEFIKYLVSVDAQRSYMQTLNSPPVRQSLLPEYAPLFASTMNATQVSEAYTGSLSHGAESPNHLLVDSSRIDALLTGSLRPVWNDCSASVTDTLTNTNTQLESLLAQIITDNTLPTLTLESGSGGTVTTNDGVGTLNFVAGSVAESTLVSVTSEQAILDSPGLVGAGSVLNVEASAGGAPVSQTEVPYGLSVWYNENSLGTSAKTAVRMAGVGHIAESTLALYWWDPQARIWVRLPDNQVDTLNHVVQASTVHFGLFAIFGDYHVYVPMLNRGP